ncbi:MAG: CoA-binding protein [Anaeromyxobacter sp.]
MPLETARRFLTLRRVALAGLSRDPKDFSHGVLEALEEAGLEVVPVHPTAAELAGRPAYPRLSAISPPVDWALLLVAPQAADGVVADGLAAGLRRYWFHRGAGAGSASPAALARCAEAGAEVVTDLCPFMVLPQQSFPHRLHAFFRRRSLARAAAAR